MTIKNRIAKLEKTRHEHPAGDVFTVRKVDYRAGIVEGVEDAPGDIPLRLVDYTQRNDDHKDPTNET